MTDNNSDSIGALCEHLNTKLFTREGADHHGLDLFARCPNCRFEGPYIECNPNEITPELRRRVLNAFDDDAAALRAQTKSEGSQ